MTSNEVLKALALPTENTKQDPAQKRWQGDQGWVCRGEKSRAHGFLHSGAWQSEIIFVVFYPAFLFSTWILKVRGNEARNVEWEAGGNAFVLHRVPSELAPGAMPVESKGTWQLEIPLGVQGDHQRQAPWMCSPTTNVTSPVLLFHIECERFTERLISNLIQCSSLKASPFRRTPRKRQGQEGRWMGRSIRVNTGSRPLDDRMGVFLSALSRRGDGWLFAEGNRVGVSLF